MQCEQAPTHGVPPLPPTGASVDIFSARLLKLIGSALNPHLAAPRADFDAHPRANVLGRRPAFIAAMAPVAGIEPTVRHIEPPREAGVSHGGWPEDFALIHHGVIFFFLLITAQHVARVERRQQCFHQLARPISELQYPSSKTTFRSSSVPFD